MLPNNYEYIAESVLNFNGVLGSYINITLYENKIKEKTMTKKVLFVDDSASMRQVLQMSINAAGYDVSTAVDGIDGSAKADKERFDVIVSDVNMPNLNGLEMVKKIKAGGINKFTPVIMLTTEAGDDMKQKGKAAGAKVWVVKPFKPDQLLTVIKKLIG